MNRHCSNTNCFIHDGEICAEGQTDISQCKAWNQTSTGNTTEASSKSNISRDVARVPWSGSALGLRDLANVAPRGRHILIGLLGAHDSGKTTVLTGSYLQLLQGKKLANSDFAGSYSLGAWESLAAWIRFDDAARAPSFPPHTPRGTSRVPGLMHIALRNSDNEFRDILLTDAPGEWFTRWAIQEEDAQAAGAKWIAENANVFIIIADCERLSGNQRGATRGAVRTLIERLGKHVNNRPTVLVWAKADHSPPEGIKSAITTALSEHIPHAIQLETTTVNPESLLSALSEAIKLGWDVPFAQPIQEPIVDHSPFNAFRGAGHAQT